MSPKEDLRVTKTKKALADAFMRLLSEKSFEDITINELCESAGIRRATFYKHFTDKFQYLASFTRSLRDNFDSYIWKSGKPGATAAYYTEYVNRILLFIKEHQKIIENIMKSGVLPAMISVIMEQNYRDTPTDSRTAWLTACLRSALSKPSRLCSRAALPRPSICGSSTE